jgi:hypothetical protein
MNLALAILFLWIAFFLFYLAFHPLPSSSALTEKGGKPSDVFKLAQTDLASKSSAYDTAVQ